jgi:hypothetical protein
MTKQIKMAAESADWQWLQRLALNHSASELREIEVAGVPLLMFVVFNGEHSRDNNIENNIECIRTLCKRGLASDIVRKSRFHAEQRDERLSTPLDHATPAQLDVFAEFDEVLSEELNKRLDDCVRRTASNEDHIRSLIRCGATVTSALLEICIRRQLVDAVALMLACGAQANRNTLPNLNAIFDNRHGELISRIYYLGDEGRDWPREIAILLYAAGWDGKSLGQFKPSNLRPRIAAARLYIGRIRLSLVAPRAVDVCIALASLRLSKRVLVVVLQLCCRLSAYADDLIEKIVELTMKKV